MARRAKLKKTVSFGLTKFKNGQYLVQDCIPRGNVQDYNPINVVGVFDDIDNAVQAYQSSIFFQ